jgi:hypothetical protein
VVNVLGLGKCLCPVYPCSGCQLTFAERLNDCAFGLQNSCPLVTIIATGTQHSLQGMCGTLVFVFLKPIGGLE